MSSILFYIKDSVLMGFLSNRQSSVHILDTFSLHSEVFSRVPQGSLFEPLLFNTFINDLYKVIKHSKYFNLFMTLTFFVL